MAQGWSEQARQLLAQAQAGDATAFGRLLELHRNYLLTIAAQELTAPLRQKAGPSDVVQDTFVEAQRLFQRFQGGEGEEFRAWIRAILLNKLSELHNRYFEVEKREVGRETSLDQSGEVGRLRDAIVGTAETPSSEAMRGEQEHLLLAALARLPELDRQVITWRNWDGLSFSEIGQRLGRSEDAARMFFGRSLERLLRELEPQHEPRGEPGAGE